jgi:hypothetical protein
MKIVFFCIALAGCSASALPVPECPTGYKSVDTLPATDPPPKTCPRDLCALFVDGLLCVPE